MNAAIPHVTPGAPPGPLDTPAADESVYAGFWIRFAAWLIDAVISIPVCLLTAWAACRIFIGPEAFSLLLEGRLDLTAATFVFSLAFSALFLAATAYGALFTASKLQATPGKFILRMKVVDGVGNRLSLPRALGRDLAKFAAGASVLLIPYVIIGWTTRKRAAHDMAAGTYVVARRAGALAPPETRLVVNAVFAKTFDVFWPNFWRFCAVAGLGFVIPLSLITASVFWGISGSGSAAGLFFGIPVLILSWLVFNSITNGGLMWGAHAAINGNAPKIGYMLTHGVRRVRQVVTISIITMILSVLAAVAAAAPGGALLLAVKTGVFGEPGLMLIMTGALLILIPMYSALLAVVTVFTAASPAAVMEDIGAFTGLKRSLHLTKDLRWRVLGVLFIAAMLNNLSMLPLQIVWDIAANAFIPQGTGVGFEADMTDPNGDMAVPLVIIIVASLAAYFCAAMAFFNTVFAALYHELCGAKGEDQGAPAPAE